MGEMSIHKPNGEKLTIQIDGTMIREQQPLEIEWCDKCEKWTDRELGEYAKYEGVKILWFCETCK
jgi:hypothetical protein